MGALANHRRLTLIALHFRSTLALLLVAGLAVALLYPFQSSREWINALQNAGHGIGFFVVTVAVLGWLPVRGSFRKTALAGISIVMVGLLVEVVQGQIGRTPSLDDAVANGVGVAAGVVWVVASGMGKGMPFIRLSAVALILLLSLPDLTQPVAQLLRPSLPVVEDFRGLLAMQRVHATYGSVIERNDADGTNAVMQLVLGEGDWPGVRLLDVATDWRGFAWLCMALDVSADTPLPLTVRVHDVGHTNTPEDRFRQTFNLTGGSTTLSINIDRIERMGQEHPRRLLDLAAIGGLSLFSRPSHAGDVIGLQMIWLSEQTGCARPA